MLTVDDVPTPSACFYCIMRALRRFDAGACDEMSFAVTGAMLQMPELCVSPPDSIQRRWQLASLPLKLHGNVHAVSASYCVGA